MADKKQALPHVSDRALELVMHDVLDGMLELSLESALSDGSSFRIVEIPPATPQPSDPNQGVSGKPADKQPQAKILPFPPPRKPVSRSA